MIQKYRKKPIVIEAIQFFNGDGPNTIDECIKFTGGKALLNNFNILIIPTLEGDLSASDGDFIIKGIQGEFYPCKPDIFEATYEAVQQSDD